MTETVLKKIENSSILVVDDTPENLHLLIHALTEEGHMVRPARSGKFALEGAHRNPPDIVLLDVNMPDMNGYDVCEALKQDPALSEVPVVFLSAMGDTFDKVRAFEVGGVDYITKPFQIEEVIVRVKTHLTIRWQAIALKDSVTQLKAALEEVRKLRDLIPICAHCKNVRDDGGYWKSIEEYMGAHAGADFSHGICPDCIATHYPELRERMSLENAGDDTAESDDAAD